MAPAKHARTAFSPPRPGKSRSTTSKKKPNARGTISKQAKSDTARRAKPTSKRSRYTSATESESDSQGGDDTADDDNDNNDEDEDEDEEMQDESATLSSNDDQDASIDRGEDSPEPDYILAEITRDDPSTPVLPLPLIHRILHSHFANPDKTKISKDAREVLGKYVEVFVREAIMRCAYGKNDDHDKNEGDHGDGDGDGDKEETWKVDGGWLEVDDLEKVAVQLCLDF